jgi:hypothetical protein
LFVPASLAALLRRLQFCKLQLNLPIGFNNELLIITKSRQGLAKREQVLWTVIAFE